MLHLKIVLLKLLMPTRRHTVNFFDGFQPGQRLMVCSHHEPLVQKVVLKLSAEGEDRKQLSSSGTLLLHSLQ